MKYNFLILTVTTASCYGKLTAFVTSNFHYTLLLSLLYHINTYWDDNGYIQICFIKVLTFHIFLLLHVLIFGWWAATNASEKLNTAIFRMKWLAADLVFIVEIPDIHGAVKNIQTEHEIHHFITAQCNKSKD